LCRTATACLAHSDVLDGVTETHWCVGTWRRSYNIGAQQLSQYRDEALYWLIQGSTRGRGMMSFLSPEQPHWLWGTHSLPFGGNQGALSPGGGGCGVKLATHLHRVPSWRKSGAVLLLPIHLNAVDRDSFTFAFDFVCKWGTKIY
jgi:hypothetical protein